MRFIGTICLVILLASCKPKICSDPIACKKIEDKLIVIKYFLDHKGAGPPYPGPEVPQAVHLLTGWTTIPSEAPGSDLGQLNPTSKDYKRWSNWYEDNKDKLYWDAKGRKVMVRK